MIYLVRHGESVSQFGNDTLGSEDIPLSEKGIKQSVEFAEKIKQEPDLIVVSPFLRAKHTAQPLIDKFPSVPVEIWDVQEFTFLGPSSYKNSNIEKLKALGKEYFEKNDSNLVIEESGESFNEMMRRVDDMLERLGKIDKNKFIIVFTHGRFMRAALMKINNMPQSVQNLLTMNKIDNLEIIEL